MPDPVALGLVGAITAYASYRRGDSVIDWVEALAHFGDLVNIYFYEDGRINSAFDKHGDLMYENEVDKLESMLEGKDTTLIDTVNLATSKLNKVVERYLK